MARPKATTPKVLLKAMIPLEYRAKLDLLLLSEVEERVPLGKYSEFVTERLREHFNWAELDLGLHGGPQGYFVRGPKDMIEWLRQCLQLLPVSAKEQVRV